MSSSLTLPMSCEGLQVETIEINVKEEMNSKENELGVEFIPDICPSQTIPVVDDIEIKHEEVDFHNNNSTPTAPEVCDFDLETLPSITYYVDYSSVKTDQTELNEFYLDLLQSERDCVTCQMYMRLLSEHLRSTHASSQPIQDPLQIDPLNTDIDPPYIDKSPSIKIKSEVTEDIEKVDCSEEQSMSNSDYDSHFELENRCEIEADCSESTHLTRNVHSRDFTKNNSSTDSKNSKTKKRNLSSRVNTAEKPFKCDECAKCFSNSDILTVHMRSHTGEKPFKCDGCDRSFSVRGSLTVHRRIHTGEKPFKCTVCEKSFRASGELTQHKRHHTGEQPFKCQVCEKSFRVSCDLTKHKRIHTGERLYKCDECEKNFTRRDQLMNHRRLHGVKKTVQV